MEKAITSLPKENFTKPAAVKDINPVLLGQFPKTDEPHSILHYINRKDPLGPPPQDPNNDPLYPFFEEGIKNWLSLSKTTP